MSKEEKQRIELPRELVVTEAFEIGERIGNGKTNAIRVLLSPSGCYLEDKIVGLKLIVNELVRRYNQLTPKWQLWQMLHKIHRKRSEGGDKYEMIAQRQFDQRGGVETQKQFKAWMDDVQKRHPVPHRAEWYICNEKDKHFVLAAAPAPFRRKDGKLVGVNVEVRKD